MSVWAVNLVHLTLSELHYKIQVSVTFLCGVSKNIYQIYTLSKFIKALNLVCFCSFIGNLDENV